MIYGDNPQKINERQDRLGLTSYSYAPQISAIVQSGNLYVYGLNNPIIYADTNGEIAVFIVTGLIGAISGGIIGSIVSVSNGGSWWKGALIGAGIGGVVGIGGGLLTSYAVTGSATASTSMFATGVQLKIGGMFSEGYSSYEAFKKVYIKAGDGKAFHHIVEQNPSNIKRFGAERIQSLANIVKIPHGSGTLHNRISAHYSSIQVFTDGLTVRQWLSLQSYEKQFAYGLKILTQYANEMGIKIEFVKPK